MDFTIFEVSITLFKYLYISMLRCIIDVNRDAASGYEYDCIGLQILLRWATNMTASGYRYYCVS